MSGPQLTFNYRSLGGGLPGSQPKGGLLGGGAGVNGGTGMEGGGERSTARFYLRNAFGNNRLYNGKQYVYPIIDTNIVRTSPFRAAFNAGDINGTVNESALPSLPAHNQVNSIQVPVLHIKPGGVHNNGGAAYAGNPKYVYDGSDYATYRRLKAINKTYNDSSFGGDQHNGSYVALRGVRRF
jgi:hypothetical protein